VGKREEMNSAESSYQQGELMEKDQKCIMIIGGIQIFLPSSPVEARVCVADAVVERQPVVTVIEEEEKEQILKSTPVEEEEHIVEFLTQWEMELKLLED
jgi:pyruvate/2-oxoglutarate/acetoin dehydrogenase E1 component